MELQVEIDVSDYKAFRSYICDRGRKKSFFVNMLAWMVVGFIGIIVIRSKNIPFHFQTFMGTWAVFVALVLFYLVKARRKFLPSNDGLILGNRRYILSSDKFVDEGENYRNELSIRAVKSLVETKDHFFVMVDKFAAIIVPKRSFRQDQSIESFVRYFADSQIKKELA